MTFVMETKAPVSSEASGMSPEVLQLRQFDVRLTSMTDDRALSSAKALTGPPVQHLQHASCFNFASRAAELVSRTFPR